MKMEMQENKKTWSRNKGKEDFNLIKFWYGEKKGVKFTDE